MGERKLDLSTILEFYDPNAKNGWLANFSPHVIEIEGRTWPTVEHYFQAMKFDCQAIQEEIRGCKTPIAAKALAKSHSSKRRPDWTLERESKMYNAILAKFTQHPDLRQKLVSTKSRVIVEAAIDDDFWGSGVDGNGLNTMGKLLMKLRGDLTESETI